MALQTSRVTSVAQLATVAGVKHAVTHMPASQRNEMQEKHAVLYAGHLLKSPQRNTAIGAE